MNNRPKIRIKTITTRLSVTQFNHVNKTKSISDYIRKLIDNDINNKGKKQ